MINKIAKFVLVVVLAIGVTSTTLAQNGLKAGPGSSAGRLKSKAPAIESSSLGKTRNVHRAGDLYFAGQFTPKDVEKIQAENFERIITLRTLGEIEWDEAKAVKDAGMEFIEVPFRAPDTMTDEVIDQIRELLKDQTKKTLFHCGSANRVGGIWLPYRVLDEGVELETALEEAKEIGLRNAGYEAKALDYIQRKQADNTPKEKSVKPGINQRFVDPELDVDNFVKRFEVESREVYLCRKQILAACAVKTGDRVADVGAGTGLFTRLFVEAVGKDGWVFAVDIAPRFVEHIRSESEKLDQGNVSAILCVEDSVNLPPESIDFAFICDTYHHFEYPKSTLASIFKAMKKDGRLVVIDFDRIPGESREWLLGHVRAGKEVFRSEIQDAGFTLIDEKKIDGFEENYFLVFRKN